MDKKTEALARVYTLILGAEWGGNNPPENQNAGPAAANDQDRLLTERVGEPRSNLIIHEDKLGEQ